MLEPNQMNPCEKRCETAEFLRDVIEIASVPILHAETQTVSIRQFFIAVGCGNAHLKSVQCRVPLLNTRFSRDERHANGFWKLKTHYFGA